MGQDNLINGTTQGAETITDISEIVGQGSQAVGHYISNIDTLVWILILICVVLGLLAWRLHLIAQAQTNPSRGRYNRDRRF